MKQNQNPKDNLFQIMNVLVYRGKQREKCLSLDSVTYKTLDSVTYKTLDSVTYKTLDSVTYKTLE